MVLGTLPTSRSAGDEAAFNDDRPAQVQDCLWRTVEGQKHPRQLSSILRRGSINKSI